MGDPTTRRVCAEVADLPSANLAGPVRPFFGDMADFAARAAEGDSELMTWLHGYCTPGHAHKRLDAMAAALKALNSSGSAWFLSLLGFASTASWRRL